MDVGTLRTLLLKAGMKGVELSESMNGTFKARVVGTFLFSRLAPVLRENDLELLVQPSGPMLLRPVTEAAAARPHHGLLSQSHTESTLGPVRRLTHQGVTVHSGHLAQLMQEPTVLLVTVGQNHISTDYILPSDIKNGLAHQKRRGALATRRTPKPWPNTSRTQQQARLQHRGAAAWLARLFG